MTTKFVHKLIKVPKLERFHVDGKRFYRKVDSDDAMNFISITTITSNYSKEKFKEWRLRVGEDEANRITKNATNRGTQMHNLIEHYLYNEELPKSAPFPKLLFDVAKPELNKINNILGIEIQLYSEYFQVAGTADLIAEYDGILSIIDYKTSERPKPVSWIEGYFVQALAYAIMLYELTGIKAKQLVIIMACENGEVEVYKETNFKKYIKLLRKYIDKFKKDHANI
jgi:CRISPR/Cas system-associated exonuclease Cas4 (RecB family)